MKMAEIINTGNSVEAHHWLTPTHWDKNHLWYRYNRHQQNPHNSTNNDNDNDNDNFNEHVYDHIMIMVRIRSPSIAVIGGS